MSKKIKGLGSQGVETSFDLEPKHQNSSKILMIFFRKQIYIENAVLTDAVFGTPPYKSTYIQKDLRGRLFSATLHLLPKMLRSNFFTRIHVAHRSTIQISSSWAINYHIRDISQLWPAIEKRR